MLTWRIWRAATNARKWRMGFNQAFKRLIQCGAQKGVETTIRFILKLSTTQSRLNLERGGRGFRICRVDIAVSRGVCVQIVIVLEHGSGIVVEKGCRERIIHCPPPLHQVALNKKRCYCSAVHDLVGTASPFLPNNLKKLASLLFKGSHWASGKVRNHLYIWRT